MRKAIFFLFIFLSLFLAGRVFAHQPELVYFQSGSIQISNPEISRAFYDQLKGKPRDYFIDSSKDFELYLNLLVPDPANKTGIYSADVFDANNQKIYSLDGTTFTWQPYYEQFGRDYYMKGPELDQKLLAGKYKIEVYSHSTGSGQADNLGKYVLAVGKTESFDVPAILNIYWQLPLLKVTFFQTSVLQFFLTPFGIGGIAVIGALLILIALISYFVAAIKAAIKHSQAKTLLLTSAGMAMKEEIKKLLQKPAYDITVAFITTAAKPEENIDYLKRDWDIMTDELGFNLEEVDIDGKKEHEVMELLKLKDIIYVEGGNTFYLLKAMRACHFEKVIRKLLKLGKVYVGVSAGSIVAGKTIKPAVWGGLARNKNKNTVHLKNFRGLNLVPFDIVVHYDRNPEIAEVIKKKLPFKWQRRKLRILTDEQAILVQGKEVDLIGKGEAMVI